MALRTKGETAEEIEGLARTMLEQGPARATRPSRSSTPAAPAVIGSGTFNISTVAAIVVAGAGVPVAKHGNRAASSTAARPICWRRSASDRPRARRGSSGAWPRPASGSCSRRTFHPAMAHAAPVRRELRVPDGLQLPRPADEPRHGRTRRSSGSPTSGCCRSWRRSSPAAASRAKLFRGEDGLDELTTTGLSTVYDVKGGTVRETPPGSGDARPRASASHDDLAGGDAARPRGIARPDPGRRETGPRRDVVLLNAGAALEVAGFAATLEEGMATAAARSTRVPPRRRSTAGSRSRPRSARPVASAADDPVRPRHPRADRGRPHRDRPVRPDVRPALVGRPARRQPVPRVRELALPLHRRRSRDARSHRTRRGEARRAVHPAPGGVRARLHARARRACPTTWSRASRASPRSGGSAC